MSGAIRDASVTRERDLSTAAARAAVGLRSRLIERDDLSAMTGIDRAGAILSAGIWRAAIERGCQIISTQATAMATAMATAPQPDCFGESSTGLPAIGRLLGAERCFAVMGHGGNGITFSAVEARLIQRELLGLPGHDANQFALAA